MRRRLHGNYTGPSFPDYLRKQAEHHLQKIKNTLEERHYEEADILGILQAMVAPHMETYNKLPGFMQPIGQHRFSLHFKHGTKKVLIHAWYSINRPLPIFEAEVLLTQERLPQAEFVRAARLAMNLDLLRRKIEVLENAVTRIGKVLTTPAQACYVWPTFRSLLPEGSSGFAMNAATVGERTRISEDQRAQFPESETLMWTQVYVDLSMQYIALAKPEQKTS